MFLTYKEFINLQKKLLKKQHNKTVKWDFWLFVYFLMCVLSTKSFYVGILYIKLNFNGPRVKLFSSYFKLNFNE